MVISKYLSNWRAKIKIVYILISLCNYFDLWFDKQHPNQRNKFCLQIFALFWLWIPMRVVYNIYRIHRLIDLKGNLINTRTLSHLLFFFEFHFILRKWQLTFVNSSSKTCSFTSWRHFSKIIIKLNLLCETAWIIHLTPVISI